MRSCIIDSDVYDGKMNNSC